MIRFLGILVGAAVAVAVLILLVGLPEFPDRSGQDAPPTGDEMHVGAALGSGRPNVAEHMDVRERPSREESGQDAPPTLADGSGQDAPPTGDEMHVEAALGSGRPNVAEHMDVRERPSREESAQDAPPTDTVGAASSREDPDHWYAFWSPFRSELAANGFVSQLQRTTGLDYRVVKVKTGVYEVAFAYSDDADAEDKLAQISAATGLDVPGS